MLACEVLLVSFTVGRICHLNKLNPFLDACGCFLYRFIGLWQTMHQIERIIRSSGVRAVVVSSGNSAFTLRHPIFHWMLEYLAQPGAQAQPVH